MPKSKTRKKKSGPRPDPTPPRQTVSVERDTPPVRTLPDRIPSPADHDPNYPVCITVDGEPRLFSFPVYHLAGQCTGRTTQGRRCRNAVWDQGQVASYEPATVSGRSIAYYGPLPEDVGDQYLAQRCRVHYRLDAAAFSDPEWEPFDVERHLAHFTTPDIDF